MKLDLVTVTTHEGLDTHVTASIRNACAEPVTVLFETQLSSMSARLIDDRGNEIPRHDRRAAQGSRFFEADKIKVRALQPGETVEAVEVFTLMPSIERALAGPMSWELTGVRSQTLTLEMIYEVTEEGAQHAVALQAPRAAVGRWVSNPVTLPYCK